MTETIENFMPALELVIPMLTKSEANIREHWAVKAKRTKQQRTSIFYELSMMHRFDCPELPVTVTLTRMASRKLDDDNLRGALKAVRDGVADFYKMNDATPFIKWEYAQEKVSLVKCPAAVKIRIQKS